LHASVVLRQTGPDWLWQNPDHSMAQLHRRLFRMEIDLCNDQSRNFGALVMLDNQTIASLCLTAFLLSLAQELHRLFGCL
jgi:hypothetical protein